MPAAWRPSGARRLVVLAWFMLAPIGQPQYLAHGQETQTALDMARVARVLVGLEADRTDVRACLLEAMRASPRRHQEVMRIDEVLAWIDQSVRQPRLRVDQAPKEDMAARLERARADERSDRFVDLVETFNHERRLDGREVAAITGGALTAEHVVAYARVRRALGLGHDAVRVLCTS